MPKYYLTKDELFQLREGQLGWQWQETGAEGWSAIYSNSQACLNAIDAEFGVIALETELTSP